MHFHRHGESVSLIALVPIEVIESLMDGTFSIPRVGVELRGCEFVCCLLISIGGWLVVGCRLAVFFFFFCVTCV
jgi:hypothetical protein